MLREAEYSREDKELGQECTKGNHWSRTLALSMWRNPELGTLNRLKWEGFSPSDWSQNRKSEVCKLTMYWDEVPRLGERGLGSRPFLILYFYSWLILRQLALVCTKFNFSSNSRWQTQFFSKFCICFSVVLFKPCFLGSSRISSPYMYSRKRILTVWSHFLCTQNSTLGMN